MDYIAGHNRNRAFELYVWLVLYFSCDNVLNLQVAAVGNALRYVVLAVWFFYTISSRVQIDSKVLIFFLISAAPSFLFSPYQSECFMKLATMAFMIFAVSGVFGGEIFTIRDLYEALFWWAVTYTILSALLLGSPLGYHATGAFHGLSGNRNPFGTAMVIANILFLDVCRNQRGIRRFFGAVFFIGSVYFIIICQSKGAFLGMLVAWIVFLFFESGVKSMIIPAVAAFLFLPILRQIPAVARVFEEGISRGDLWEYGIAEFWKNPIIGAGFGVSYLNNWSDTNLNMAYNYHNAYISILTDVGVWGAVGFIFMFYRILKSDWIYVREIGEHETVVLMSIIMSFFAQAWGESFLLAAGNPLCLVSWMCMIALMCGRYE